MAVRPAEGGGLMASVYVTQRSPGTFSIRFRIGSDPVTGRSIERRITFRTEDAREAGIPFKLDRIKRWAEQRLSEMAKEYERAAPEQNQLVGTWINHWAEHISETQVRGDRTRARYVENLLWHVQPYPISRIRLTDLTGLDVQQHLGTLQQSGNRRTGGGLSPRTCVHVQQALRRCLKAAVAARLIPTNPANAEHVEAVSVPRREARACSVQELAELLRRLDGHSKEVPFAVAIFLGLRRGEVCGLGLDDIVLTTDPATLRVRWALTCYGEHSRNADGFTSRVQRISLKSPKTEAGRRTLEIPPVLAASLKGYIARQQSYWDKLGVPWPSYAAPDGSTHRPLFHNLEGGDLHPDNLSKEFTRQCRKAGIPKTTMHTMRHSFVTRLLSRPDITVKAVAAAAGHGDVRVTQLVYWHLTEEAAASASAAIHDDASRLTRQSQPPKGCSKDNVIPLRRRS